jgi:SecD/SecF fusion protein
MTTRFPNRFVAAISATAVLALIAACFLTQPSCSAAESEKPKAGKQETVLLFEPVPAATKVATEKVKPPSGQEKPEVDLKNTIAVLDRRLNPGGLRSLFSRIKVEATGGGRIQVTVPSTDPKEVTRVHRMVESLGTLEFRVLATDQRTSSPDFKAMIQAAKALPQDQTRLFGEKKGDEPARLLAWWVPVTDGKEDEFRDPYLGTREVIDRNSKKHLEVLVVNDNWNVTGECLTQASAGADTVGQPCVNFAFNQAGAEKFGRLTGFYSPDTVQNVRYHLGIILDGKLFTAPRLNSVIFDRGEISGGFTAERVKELVDVLNAGALPVALRKVSP